MPKVNYLVRRNLIKYLIYTMNAKSKLSCKAKLDKTFNLSLLFKSLLLK